jgi:hypothetical protein
MGISCRQAVESSFAPEHLDQHYVPIQYPYILLAGIMRPVSVVWKYRLPIQRNLDKHFTSFTNLLYFKEKFIFILNIFLCFACGNRISL